MNKKPITIVTDFEAEYMERIQNYTLKDLADKFGMQYSMNTVDCINLYISFIRQIIIKSPNIWTLQINEPALAKIWFNKHGVHVFVIRECIILKTSLKLYPTIIQIIDGKIIIIRSDTI